MQAVKFTDITSLDHSRIVLSGSDRRERIVPSVMNGKSVLFYHYRSYFCCRSDLHVPYITVLCLLQNVDTEVECIIGMIIKVSLYLRVLRRSLAVKLSEFTCAHVLVVRTCEFSECLIFFGAQSRFFMLCCISGKWCPSHGLSPTSDPPAGRVPSHGAQCEPSGRVPTSSAV